MDKGNKINDLNLEDPSKVRLRLWLRLLKISRGVEGKLREKLRTDFESTLPRFDVMAALYRYSDGLKMSELSNALKVSNGNITGIVDRLVKDGLVSRTPVPDDRRALLVSLTPKGNSEFVVQAEQHEKWIDEIFSNIETNEVSHVMEMFDLVASKIYDDEADENKQET